MQAGLMMAAGPGEWKSGTDKKDEFLAQMTPTLTLPFFRHNCVTMLYESGVDPLVEMKIVGHSNHQTTEDVYTHIKDQLLKKTIVNMSDVLRIRVGSNDSVSISE